MSYTNYYADYWKGKNLTFAEEIALKKAISQTLKGTPKRKELSREEKKIIEKTLF